MSKHWLAVVAACALALAGAGCGSESDDPEVGSGGSATTISGVGPDAQAAIDAAYRGSFGEVPAESPDPRRGLNVWFIPIGADLANWREPGQIYEVADTLGWDLTLFDGRFSPDTVVTGIRQAIADKADGIILFVVDCAPVKAGLQAADRAGVPVVNAQAFDCDQLGGGGPRLFDAQVTYQDPRDPANHLPYETFIADVWAYSQGLGIIAGTEGRAKLIDVVMTDIQAVVIGDKGVRQALSDHCPDCEIVADVNITGSEIGAPLQQKVEQAFVQRPDANAISTQSDATLEPISSAVRATGRADEIWVQAAEGAPTSVSYIKRGRGANAAVGYSLAWELWAEADALNRLIAGERPEAAGGVGFPSGLGVQLFDRDHNLPEGDIYEPPVDFRGDYLRAWGVDGAS